MIKNLQNLIFFREIIILIFMLVYSGIEIRLFVVDFGRKNFFFTHLLENSNERSMRYAFMGNKESKNLPKRRIMERGVPIFVHGP